MTWLSDETLAHLRQLASMPEDVPRYEILDKIGQGGMGTVFRAHDRVLDRTVAVKVLHPVLAADARARMLREARIIARLEHPGIVPVHDAGELPDGRFYYAMKLVRGRRLDEEAARLPELADRLQLFQKICEAIAFAHAHGVLHRDLKPQNVMVGEFGEVLVMDWGVAKVLDAPADLSRGIQTIPRSVADTRHGTVLGTPGYMPPEQARGEVEQLDARADVFALGAILYFLLAGQAPATPATPPRQLKRSIPRPIQAVCLKALAADREQRYSSATELAGDVADFLAGRRVRAYPESLWDVARRWEAKHRTAILLVGAYLVMRVLLLIFTKG